MIEKLGNIGEFVAAIATVITLIYLAFQLRQNTRALKAAAFQNVTSEMGKNVEHIMDNGELAEYQLLAASDIDWTLLRCPLIDSAPYKSSPRVSLLTPSSFHLRAAELADFVIREVEAPSYVREAPFLYSE